MTPRRLLLIAATIDLVAPVAAAAVVLFGGATIDGSCHSTVGDGGLRPACPVQVAVWPPLRTPDGIAISLVLCAIAWLVANYVVLAHIVKVDPRRLMPLAAGIGVVAIGLAAIGFVLGIQVRLRYAAEGAITWGLAGLLLAWILAIAWAGLRPGQGNRALA